ncbi:PAS domain S-box protein [Allocoleopsis sp.]|uniref:PAS domain-containing hybrid sensor histidine kinase/response regulator n=1 Tax=Allocoleopsis sp. TaxID=3088169 RepID=UPI002FCFCCB5
MLALLADWLLEPFIPHGHCYLWKPGLVGLHLVSDALIALAYYSIPLSLVYFVRNRRDLPFDWIFLLFGAFIVACGTTHIMEVWTLWHPHYWLSGFIKAITAGVSVCTAVLLVPLIPKALALPSPAELEVANRQLEREIREHAATAAQLQRALQQLTFHVENTPLAVIELNSEFRVQRWSKQAEKLFGWQAEEVFNQRLDEGRFVFEADFPLVQQDMSRLLDGSEPHIFGTNRNYTKDGSVIYCEWYNSALWNQSDELVSILSLALDVTERTHAEQALKESEARYRTLVETSPDAISVSELNGKLLFCNRQVTLLHGYESETELLGRFACELIAPECRNIAEASLQNVLSQGSIRDVEYTMLRKDGSRFPGEVSASLIRDVQGNPQAIIGLVRDITDRKSAEDALKKAKEHLEVQVEERTAQLKLVNDHLLLEIQERAVAEEALRKSEARLNQALCAAQMGAWDWDMMSDRMTWSEGTEALFGLRPGDLAGSYDACMDYLHPDDRPRVIQSLRRTVETGTDYEVESRIICTNGTIRWVASKGALIRNPNGIVVRMTGTLMDITKRKQIELALERERQQLRQIIACAPIAMAMFDTQMRYQAYSQTWITVQGLEGQSILGRSHYEIFPDLPERWKAEHQRALQGEVISVSEDIWERQDGTTVYLRWAIHPWYTPDGEIGGIVIATDRINELVEAREAALEAARLKSQFLANMSHEIRTPMNGVLGMAGLLLQTSLTPQQLEYASTIRSSAEHLLTVINDILDFSKLEAGEMQLESIDFDLDSCIESVADVLAAQAQDKGLELAIWVESDVPKQLRGDPNRLRQILLNLVGNAVKFTEAGQVVVKATLELEGLKVEGLKVESSRDNLQPVNVPSSTLEQLAKVQPSNCVRIRFEVSDTGIGISDEDKEKLFQSFSQVDASMTRQYGGTGLGLVICKQLVELMGGEIGVESVLGEGSRFWFTASFDTLAVEEVVACPLVFRNLKLLVVCDRETTRQAVCAALHRSAIPSGSTVPTRLLTDTWEMQLDEAVDTQTTLNALRSSVAQGNPYDVALLDLQLPKPQGELLVPMIRSDPTLAHTKLIVMTTSDRLDTVQELEAMDISGYLIKPIRASRLFNCLVSALAPREKDIDERVSGREQEATPENPKPPQSSLKILLVEDHEVNQMVTLNQLAMLGFEADCVGNGEEAIAQLEQQNYDLVLMDCQMPVLDGYETTKEIRRREGSDRHTTIIALTAHALSNDREKCLAAGMDDYLSKPIAQEALGAMIEHWTKRTIKPTVADTNSAIKHSLQLSNLSLEETPLDLERLKAISRGKVTFQQQLVQAFIKNAQPGLEQIRHALQVNDFDIIVQQAHRIKGASANVGVRLMPEVAAQLEQQARDKKLEGAMEKLEALEKQLEQVKAFLENWCIQ